jgi:hypothetical protein
VINLTREQNVSFLSKLNKMSSSCAMMDEVPRLPIPINKMNCSVARTSLARLLRYLPAYSGACPLTQVLARLLRYLPAYSGTCPPTQVLACLRRHLPALSNTCPLT